MNASAALRRAPRDAVPQWLRRLSSRTPIRVKLVAALLALVVLALAAAGVAATTALRGYLLQRVDDQLRQAANPFADDGGPGARGRRELRLPSEFYVAYLNAAGARVGGSDSTLGGDAPPALPTLTPAQALARSGQPFTVDASTGSSQWRVVAAPLAYADGSVLAALSLSGVQRTVNRLVVLQLGIGATVVVVLAGVGHLAVRRSLQPLGDVEHTAAAIAAGDLSRRVPDSDPRTEVGRLAAALNGMLGQIERAFRTQQASEAAARRSEEQMRRFVGDASHELRTPLTSIRGFAELYRQGAVTEPDDLARVLRRIEEESARMGLLVEDLLLLARLDHQRPLERHLVDLLTLAADAAQDARALAPDRRVALDVVGSDTPPVVLGDEARLRQVLGNLVSNALTHTPAGTPIAVRVGTQPAADGTSEAVLEVADRGPGLEPDDAARVFERFYRADRSRHRGTGGSGLGLSIVAGLTAAHGGRVELQTEAGQGATFRVLLPLASEPNGVSGGQPGKGLPCTAEPSPALPASSSPPSSPPASPAATATA